MTITTVSPSANVDDLQAYHVTSGISPDRHQETDYTHMPITLLWIPYVCLTLLILLFVLASFLHFHRRHGHKYGTRGDPDEPRDVRRPFTPACLAGWWASLGGRGHRDAEVKDVAASGSRKRRPLKFQSNCNGSMVEVRCGVLASLTTFERLDVENLEVNSEVKGDRVELLIDQSPS